MRSEKEQSAGSRERGSVEIQFRDCQREQDNVTVNPKHKEEKKEIFSKVGKWRSCLDDDDDDDGGNGIQHHRQRRHESQSKRSYWYQSLQTQMHSHIKTVNYPFE